MTKLVIIGAGGHGAVVADAALLMAKWSEIVFLDDKDFGLTTADGCTMLAITPCWISIDNNTSSRLALPPIATKNSAS